MTKELRVGVAVGGSVVVGVMDRVGVDGGVRKVGEGAAVTEAVDLGVGSGVSDSSPVTGGMFNAPVVVITFIGGTDDVEQATRKIKPQRITINLRCFISRFPSLLFCFLVIFALNLYSFK